MVRAKQCLLIGLVLWLNACFSLPHFGRVSFSGFNTYELSCEQLELEAERLSRLWAEPEYAGQEFDSSLIGIPVNDTEYPIMRYEALLALDKRRKDVWRAQSQYCQNQSNQVPKDPPSPQMLLSPLRSPPNKAPSLATRRIYRF